MLFNIKKNDYLYQNNRSFLLLHRGCVCFASTLLAHPNALHFGTGLRTFLLKNNPLDCFILAHPAGGAMIQTKAIWSGFIFYFVLSILAYKMLLYTLLKKK